MENSVLLSVISMCHKYLYRIIVLNLLIFIRYLLIFVNRLKFANNIPYKYKTSRASKATRRSSKHLGAKHNLTRNQDSKSFKVTCLESVEKQ